MSTYKVIQDIEAEDKLLGPLTLRQFVYAAIVVVSVFLGFKLAVVHWYLALPLLPHTIFFLVLAAPFGHDQSNEVWLLAKIRFFLKPRRRIWDQSGIKELVTITVPKKIERHLTNGLDQDQVKSRLAALANTIDSRGWAVKNVNVNMFSQPAYVMDTGSDRLVDLSSLPQEVPTYQAAAADDILDERSNPTAQHLDQMITASTQAHHQQLVQSMQTAGAAQPVASQQNNWFMSPPPNNYATAQPPQPQAPATPTITAPVMADANAQALNEQQLLDKLHAKQNTPDPTYDHMRTINPLGDKQPPKVQTATTVPEPQPTTTATPVNPAIIELAHNDDLNVATLARQANKEQANKEVVISLR